MLRWKRQADWKRIRVLVDAKGWRYAEIHRMGGNRYVVSFVPQSNLPIIEPYDLRDSTLATAKAIGLVIVRTNITLT